MAAPSHLTYADFLRDNKLAETHRIPYYVRWVESFANYCGGKRSNLTWGRIGAFISKLASGGKLEDWQIRQADDSLRIYATCYLPQVHGIDLSEHGAKFSIPSEPGVRSSGVQCQGGRLLSGNVAGWRRLRLWGKCGTACAAN